MKLLIPRRFAALELVAAANPAKGRAWCNAELGLSRLSVLFKAL